MITQFAFVPVVEVFDERQHVKTMIIKMFVRRSSFFFISVLYVFASVS